MLSINAVIAFRMFAATPASAARNAVVKDSLDLAKAMRDAGDNAPSFQVDYVSVEGDALASYDPENGFGAERREAEAEALLKARLVRTEADTLIPSAVTRRATAQDKQVARFFLRVANRSTRRAEDVHVVIRATRPTQAIVVYDRLGAEVPDFRDVVAAAAATVGRRDVRLGDLEPGEARMLPLFTALFPPARARKSWEIVPGPTLLPDSLRYGGPGAARAIPVRPMRDPARISSGVEVRG